jgi:hypothetical protein
VELVWETAYGKEYEIQISDDCTNWTPIYNTPTGDGGTDTIYVGRHSARCVRMKGIERGSEWGYSLLEFKVLFLTPTFDTGPGTYPSINGTHNGTIKPYHDVNVSLMYTYPCAGTGGHSEYVKFWNSTWNVSATWKGYQGEWHNITFDVPFVLEQGKIYNYTIRAGSYPQIHHTDRLKTKDGVITCTSFVDANRKEYDDWIPAIKLE